MIILYDAVGSLVESVGAEAFASRSEHVAKLLPPLMDRWNRTQDDDKGLLPLMECFGCVARTLGAQLQAVAAPVYQRCLRVVQATLVSHAAWQARNFEGEDPLDLEFVVCSLDLVSALCEGLGPGVEAVLSGSNVCGMLAECLRMDQDAEVLRSALALLGDLATSCFAALGPALDGALVPAAIERIDAASGGAQDDPQWVAVANNACWALGEVAVKAGAQRLAPFVGPIMQRAVPVVNDPRNPEALLQNSAICLARLGLVCADAVAPHAQHFLVPTCVSLRQIREDVEKDHSFRGICMVLQKNPQAALGGGHEGLYHVLDAFARYERPAADLEQMFRTVLNGYRQQLGAQWPSFAQQLPPDLQRAAAERFGLG
jgi:transportin-1